MKNTKRRKVEQVSAWEHIHWECPHCEATNSEPGYTVPGDTVYCGDCEQASQIAEVLSECRPGE